jgi:two-component system phosphate regulon response regulator PhoB
MSESGRSASSFGRLLIIEDDADIRNLLKYNFENEGYTAVTAEDGRYGLDRLRREPPDLVILDLMLPDMDGLSVCGKIRGDPALADIPVLMLTALGEETNRISGFERGADDYVVKPFSPRELVLRVKSLLQRSRGARGELEEQDVYVLGGLRVEMEAFRVLVDGEEAGLTTTEFQLLQTLLRAGKRVLSREQLLERVWGYEFVGYDRTVDTHLHRLRHKLGPYSACIQTVRGVGYRFNSRMDSHGEL